MKVLIEGSKFFTLDSVKYKVLEGTSINIACAEAIAMAEVMRTTVEFSFNGTKILVDGQDTVNEKVSYYINLVNTRSTTKNKNRSKNLKSKIQGGKQC